MKPREEESLTLGYMPVSSKAKTTEHRILTLRPVALDFQNAVTVHARQEILVSPGMTAQSPPKGEVYFYFKTFMTDEEI